MRDISVDPKQYISEMLHKFKYAVCRLIFLSETCYSSIFYLNQKFFLDRTIFYIMDSKNCPVIISTGLALSSISKTLEAMKYKVSW